MMKSKDLQPRLFYPAKLSFELNGRGDKVLPRQGKAKGVHHHQAIFTGNVKRNLLKKKKTKNMNIKKATNSQLSTTESKKKNKLSK